MSTKYAAIVPAAGMGTRLPDKTQSKEVLAVGTRSGRARPAIAHLLACIDEVDVDEVAVVLRAGKRDIREYLGGEDAPQLTYRLANTTGTRGVAETVGLGLQSLDAPASYSIVFGFPDILLKPSDAYVHLVSALENGDADVVLGLFPTQTPSKMDMVAVDDEARVLDIQIKPANTELSLTWILAVWRPTFSACLQDMLSDDKWIEQFQQTEAHLGSAFLAAMAKGLRIDAVAFPDGQSLDIGTPEDYERAQHWID